MKQSNFNITKDHGVVKIKKMSCLRNSALIILLIIPYYGLSRHYEKAFVSIDAHARNVPYSYTSDKTMLVNYLIQPCKNDWQKVRAIFVWMTNNIAYDVDSYKNNTVTSEKCQADYVLRHRKGVCSGYADLFRSMCLIAGVYCFTVEGYSKGVGHYPGKVIDKTNHAWNICEIDEKMHLFDVTWAAGYYSYGSFVRMFDDFWWDTPPEHFITTHFATTPQYNCLTRNVSKAEFEQMAEIREVRKPLQKTTASSFQISLSVDGTPEYYNGFPNLDIHRVSGRIGRANGRRGAGQNFTGLFASMAVDDERRYSLEAGTVWRRLLRLSGGVVQIQEQIVPSATLGLQINLRSFFIGFNSNAVWKMQKISYFHEASLGITF